MTDVNANNDGVRRRKLEIAQARDKAYKAICQEEKVQRDKVLRQKRNEYNHRVQIEERRAQGIHQAASIFGSGYSIYGNGNTDGKPRILYPKERKRPRRHLRELTYSKADVHFAAQTAEILVPIRLDLDYDKYKLRDTFVWNLVDKMPIDVFSEHLCEDYQLPLVGFASDIDKSIRSQLSEHHPHKFPEAQVDETDKVYTNQRDDDMRISIKLDITVGTCNLVDQFEWDLNNSHNDAERFACGLTLELGLSMEFRTAIAHTIREQCQMYTKTLFLVGHSFDGRAVEDSDVRQMIMPTIYSTLRPRHLLDRFAPAMLELTPEQLDRIDKEREREGRRNRRQTRGKRGVNLPDLSDIPKSYRTPYISSVLVSEEERNASIRAPNTGIDGADDDSDEDYHRDHDNARIVADRNSRAARRSNYTHYEQQSHPQALPPSRDSRTAMSSHSMNNHPHKPVYVNPQVMDAKHHERAGRSEPPDHADDPTPSLIVRLKVPKLRQFLEQQQLRRQQTMAPTNSYAKSFY